MIPVYVAQFTRSLYFSPILGFVLFQFNWVLNEVAKELENPFGSDTNDISLADFHARFMESVLEIGASHKAKMDVQVDRDKEWRKRSSVSANSEPTDLFVGFVAEQSA